MKVHDIAALQWLLLQPGLKMIVGKNERVTLIYGHSFEIHDEKIADAVTMLQEAQTVKDKCAERSRDLCGT